MIVILWLIILLINVDFFIFGLFIIEINFDLCFVIYFKFFFENLNGSNFVIVIIIIFFL